MRIIVGSAFLALALGVGGCASSTVESLDQESEASQALEEPRPPALTVWERAEVVVKKTAGLAKLHNQLGERIKRGALTPVDQSEIQQLVQQMRAVLVTLPAEATWVSLHVEEHKSSISAELTKELESKRAKAVLGDERINELKALFPASSAETETPKIIEVIQRSTTTIRDHSLEVGDMLGRGKLLPHPFFCGMVGLNAGAQAALENWPGMVLRINDMLRNGCLRI
jgi:hypothetical protein